MCCSHERNDSGGCSIVEEVVVVEVAIVTTTRENAGVAIARVVVIAIATLLI